MYFRSNLSGHFAAQKIKHLRKFTSGFIGSQILNFAISISLSPVTRSSLVPPCTIPFGGPARHKTVEVDQKVKGKLCKLNRKKLEKLYLIYIRPIFEYAFEVWDNSGVSNSCKLERLPLEAARIITGLPIFTNTEYLYRETGWERLDERRTRRKLQLLYNIQNDSTPSYLLDLTPSTIQSTTIYPLRNGNNIIVPFCRLSLTKDSFVSATVREWSNLNLTVRNLDTLSKFKKAIRSSIAMPIPRHYSYGPRKLNIILTQLRCNAPFLNYDLCKVTIISNASCDCGAPCENFHHFFFDCDKYTDNREILFNSLNWLPSNINIDVNLLTKRSDLLTYQENITIFKHAFKYIKDSKRFTIV